MLQETTGPGTERGGIEGSAGRPQGQSLEDVA